MTSNQLAYWRDQETKRSNITKETETQRHNVTSEDLTRAQQELDKLNLDYKGQELKIKNAQTLNDLNELYAKYGTFAAESIPWDVRSKVLSDLGVEVTGARATDDDATSFNQFWGEFREFWKNLTSGLGAVGRGIGGVAKLF